MGGVKGIGPGLTILSPNIAFDKHYALVYSCFMIESLTSQYLEDEGETKEPNINTRVIHRSQKGYLVLRFFKTRSTEVIHHRCTPPTEEMIKDANGRLMRIRLTRNGQPLPETEEDDTGVAPIFH